MIAYIYTLFIFISLSGCKNKIDKGIELNPKIKEIIEAYIDSCKYEAYLLKINPKIDSVGGYPTYISNSFLLGPAYKELLDEDSRFIEVNQKHIYFSSDFNSLFKINRGEKLYYEHSQDSIILGDIVYRDPGVLFLFKAIYFYENANDIFAVSYRPDTIFAPRLIPNNSIKFRIINEK